MRDRARDWSERGRRPRAFLPILRAALPLARSLLISVDEKRDCVQSRFVSIPREEI